MPIHETFWNPYRLVSIQPEKEQNKSKPVSHEKFSGKSGIIHCTLENLTALFIGGHGKKRANFLTCRDKKIIPGSSLKGMIRSLAETIKCGCYVTGKDNKNKIRYDRTYIPCNHIDSLCMTCRMFGMTGRGKDAKSYQGRIGFSDAIIAQEIAKSIRFEVYLASNGTRHERFYLSPDTGLADGKARKFYFHQPKRKSSVPPLSENIKRQGKSTTIDALPPGNTFQFTVHFTNLAENELELLVYCLALEPHIQVEIPAATNGPSQPIRLAGPMCHKIGFAKPLGLGSCRMTITQMVYLEEPQQRYASLRQPKEMVLQAEPLAAEITRLTQKLAADTSSTMMQLRKMLIWDESDPRDFKYPCYKWFEAPDNPQKEIKKL